MDEHKRKAFNELCNNVIESMNHTFGLMNAVLRFANPEKSEETPEKVKMVKKRMPKKVKTNVVKELTMTSDILTLNANAPIADHHYGDKGKGEIDFDRLE